MNYTENDRGEMVIAEGSPGSEKRMSVESPALIQRLNDLWMARHGSPGRGVDEAIEMIRKAGIQGALETSSLLACSYYGKERKGSVTDLVMVGN